MRFELRNGWAARARALATAAAVLVVALPAGDAGATAPKPADGDVVPGRYIVVYEESVAAADAETGRNERALGFKAKLRFHRAIKGFSASLTPFQVSKLRADPQVAFVTPDRRVRALGAVPLAAGDAAPTGVRR